jgi:hypothetical protein
MEPGGIAIIGAVVLVVVVLVVVLASRRKRSAVVAVPAAPVAQAPTAPTNASLGDLPPPAPTERAAPIPPLSSAEGSSALLATGEVPEVVDMGGGDGTQARPGWYPDPQRGEGHRWWDGKGWTEHLS